MQANLINPFENYLQIRPAEFFYSLLTKPKKADDSFVFSVLEIAREYDLVYYDDVFEKFCFYRINGEYFKVGISHMEPMMEPTSPKDEKYVLTDCKVCTYIKSIKKN